VGSNISQRSASKGEECVIPGAGGTVCGAPSKGPPRGFSGTRTHALAPSDTLPWGLLRALQADRENRCLTKAAGSTHLARHRSKRPLAWREKPLHRRDFLSRPTPIATGIATRHLAEVPARHHKAATASPDTAERHEQAPVSDGEVLECKRPCHGKPSALRSRELRWGEPPGHPHPTNRPSQHPIRPFQVVIGYLSGTYRALTAPSGHPVPTWKDPCPRAPALPSATATVGASVGESDDLPKTRANSMARGGYSVRHPAVECRAGSSLRAEPRGLKRYKSATIGRESWQWLPTMKQKFLRHDAIMTKSGGYGRQLTVSTTPASWSGNEG
jgi:hypothetical protein